jgi:hypothetical protein
VSIIYFLFSCLFSGAFAFSVCSAVEFKEGLHNFTKNFDRANYCLFKTQIYTDLFKFDIVASDYLSVLICVYNLFFLVLNLVYSTFKNCSSISSSTSIFSISTGSHLS